MDPEFLPPVQHLAQPRLVAGVYTIYGEVSYPSVSLKTRTLISFVFCASYAKPDASFHVTLRTLWADIQAGTPFLEAEVCS